MEARKRYAANLEIFIYAKDDNEAQQRLQDAVEYLKRGDSENDASATKLVEIPFGSISPRNINIKN